MLGARIFIRYARGSKTRRTLRTGLEPVLRDAGHESLRDEPTLEPGDAFRKKLARRMMRCDGALRLLSPEALESQGGRSSPRCSPSRGTLWLSPGSRTFTARWV